MDDWLFRCGGLEERPDNNRHSINCNNREVLHKCKGEITKFAIGITIHVIDTKS